MSTENSLKGLSRFLNEISVETIASKTSEIHKASTIGNLNLLHKCMEEVDVNINIEDENGYTPLCMATLNSHMDVVDILLKQGATINTSGINPIHLVSNEEIAKSLVYFGGDINARDDQGNTALHRAVAREDVGVTNVLLESGCSPNTKNAAGRTPLHEAFHFKTDGIISEIINKLISAGACVNIKDNIGKTPLHHACESLDMYTSMTFLLDHGAVLNEPDWKGFCPPHYLIENFTSSYKEEDQLVTRMDSFLKDETLTSVRTANGQTALHLAVANSLCHVVHYLIQKGCDVNGRDGNAKCPIHFTAASKEPSKCHSIIQNLISCGGDIDCRDWWGFTPLIEAIRSNNMAVIKVLLDCGADVNVHDNNCDFPLHFAAAVCPDAIEDLIEKGSVVNATDKYLSTPLHFSAWAESWYATDLLIKHGAYVEAKDISHCTPRDSANLKSSEVVTLLSTGCNECHSTLMPFSCYANRTLSKEDLNEIIAKHSKIYRSDPDLKTFFSSILGTQGVGHALHEGEAQEIHNAVEELVQNLARMMSEIDPRFHITILRAGSSSEGTKTGLPDEYDFMFCLEDFNEIIYPVFQEEDTSVSVDAGSFSSNKGQTLQELFEECEPTENIAIVSDYTNIYIKDEGETKQFLEFCENDDKKIPCHVMYNQFSQLLAKVLLSPCFPKHPNLTVKEVMVDPAVSLQWRGCRYKIMDIHVDIVPAVRLPSWPENTRGQCNLITPDILSIPSMAVTKMASGGNEDLWRCSMSLQETAIFRKLRPCIRNSYTTAKALLNSVVVCPLLTFTASEDIQFHMQRAGMLSESEDEDCYMTITAGKAVPSYILKMMFLYSLEEKVMNEGLESICEEELLTSQTDRPVCNNTEVEESISNKDSHLSGQSTIHPNQRTFYGPAEIKNKAMFTQEVDVELVRDIYRRCEACISEGSLPSFFNPKQDILGNMEDQRRIESALIYIRFIKRLLE